MTHGYKTTDFGNNETMGRGIVKVSNTYVAMTFTRSQTYKTLAGAIKFMRKAGLDAHGNRI